MEDIGRLDLMLQLYLKPLSFLHASVHCYYIGVSATSDELLDIATQTPHSSSSIRMTPMMKHNFHLNLKKQHPPEYVVLDMTVSSNNSERDVYF